MLQVLIFDEETYHLWTEKSSYREKLQRMIMYKSKKGRMFLGSFKNYSFMLYVDGWLEWLDSRKVWIVENFEIVINELNVV